jgi:hypothetical protein
VTYAEQLILDLELRDDLQLVSLTNAVTQAMAMDILAKNRGINFREAQLGGSLGLEPTDQVFVLGCNSLAGAVPHKGDFITSSDDTRWTILSVSQASVGDTAVTYTCICRGQ